MKKCVMFFILTVLFLTPARKVKAQADELAQLALDIEKLAQFKQILSDLKKGYEILFGGYNTIRTISKGNFELHKLFLDGLLAVNPAIKNYKRVADIIDYQVSLVKEYKTASSKFKKEGWFNADELNYISSVYDQLFTGSLKNLDDLATILTASKLRMNDAERIDAIDHLYDDMEDKLTFLRSFNNSTSLLAAQRAKEEKETQSTRQLLITNP